MPPGSRPWCLCRRAAHRPPAPIATFFPAASAAVSSSGGEHHLASRLIPLAYMPGPNQPHRVILFTYMHRRNHSTSSSPVPISIRSWVVSSLRLFTTTPLPAAPQWDARSRPPLSPALYRVRRCLGANHLLFHHTIPHTFGVRCCLVSRCVPVLSLDRLSANCSHNAVFALLLRYG
jgi:hypothetical protein